MAFSSTIATRGYLYANTASGPWDIIADYPFSLAMWYYPLSSGDGSQCIFGYGNDNGTTDFHCLFYDTFANDAFTIVSRQGGGGTVAATETAGNSPINSWYFLTAVYNSSTSRELFKNGISVASNTTSVTYTQANFDNVTLNFLPTSTTGVIDNSAGLSEFPMIFNKALSQAEILELYRNPYSVCDQLVFSWNFFPQQTTAANINELSPYGYATGGGTANYNISTAPAIFL